MGIIEKIVYVLTGRSKRTPTSAPHADRFATYKQPEVVCNSCTNKGDKKPHPDCRMCGFKY